MEPTQETLVDLDRAIIDLKNKKATIVTRKQKLELDSSKIKDLMSDPNLVGPEHGSFSVQRNIIKRNLSNIEMEIREINLEIKEKTKLRIYIDDNLRNKKKTSASESLQHQELLKLKEKYQSFASDNTRISSMRIMASQLVEQLDLIINL